MGGMMEYYVKVVKDELFDKRLVLANSKGKVYDTTGDDKDIDVKVYDTLLYWISSDFLFDRIFSNNFKLNKVYKNAHPRGE